MVEDPVEDEADPALAAVCDQRVEVLLVTESRVDPAVLEAMVVKHFTAWQGKGPAPASPAP